MWTEKYRRERACAGRGGGEMERYHRQLLIPVAYRIQLDDPSRILVKENNVNNNESSDDRVSSSNAIRLSESRKRSTRKTTVRGSVHRWQEGGGGKREINSR